MEDVLEVYTRPHDPERPLVCLGRDLQAVARRDAPTDPDEARTPGSLRLRVRAQRNRQSLHDDFAPLEGLGAMSKSPIDIPPWTTAHVLKELGRSTLRQCQDHRSGPGQSQHFTGKASLYEAFQAVGSQAAGERFEWPLHAKAWQLA